ncbi:MAG: response regulator [Elusimicrobiales bacterium]|jgi:CheY-like chemotaxis protein
MEKRKRIVVLDDNEVFASLIAADLETDYEVVVGLNGRDGLRLCLAAHTDLLVTDIGMPELDGIQMLEEFQKDGNLSAIPVIVVTATHFTTRSRSDVARYPQVRGVLSKTCDMAVIMTHIRQAL